MDEVVLVGVAPDDRRIVAGQQEGERANLNRMCHRGIGEVPRRQAGVAEADPLAREAEEAALVRSVDIGIGDAHPEAALGEPGGEIG